MSNVVEYFDKKHEIESEDNTNLSTAHQSQIIIKELPKKIHLQKDVNQKNNNRNKSYNDNNSTNSSTNDTSSINKVFKMIKKMPKKQKKCPKVKTVDGYY